MIRWVVAGAVAALGILWLALELRDTRAELAAAEARAEAYDEAARIHRRHVAQLEAARAEAGALDRELQEGEGADALLSDYLGRGAGRVWP